MSVVVITKEAAEERWQDKLIRKFKAEPWVPIGTGLTCLALFMASRTLAKKGDSKELNRWFRLRVIFQGLTVVGIVAGSFSYEAAQQRERALQEAAGTDQRTQERREFEARMRGAEEAHALEQAMAKEQEKKDEPSMWQKLGLGRGSHKTREASVKTVPSAEPSTPPSPAPAPSPPAAAGSTPSPSSPAESKSSWFSWPGTRS